MEETFLFYNYLPLLADHILDFPLQRYPRGIIPRHNYPLFYPSNVKDGDVIFVKSDLLGIFFFRGLPKINAKFYLLSGIAGKDVGQEFESYVNNDKIIKWVGCNLLFTHPKVLKIPIGFEEVERCVGGPASGEGGDQKLLKKLYNSRRNFDEKMDKLLITYVGNTHSSRSKILGFFKTKKNVYFANKMKFENYMKKIDEYKFVLCPRGCGTDTHRFWEVILMGSIPVLESSGLDELYRKFPCIIMNSYTDLKDEDFANFEIDENLKNNTESFLLLENFKKKVLKFINKIN